MSTVSHVRMPPTQSKVIFKNVADGQELKALQMDRETEGRQTQGRGASDTFKLACQVESRGGDDGWRNWSLSLSHWWREAFRGLQVTYSGLD